MNINKLTKNKSKYIIQVTEEQWRWFCGNREMVAGLGGIECEKTLVVLDFVCVVFDGSLANGGRGGIPLWVL